MPTVLITGANRGIGLEFARQYKADGWDVVASLREPADAGELAALGIRVEQADMRDLDAVVALAQAIEPPLDLLIANAGTWTPESIDTPNDGQAWADMMIVNTIAPVLLARSLVPRVSAARGKLIAITSRMGSIADNSSGGHVPYRASKAALNMAWHSLAIEYRSQEVTLAVLNPGWVRTRMGGPNAPTPPDHSVAAMRRVIDRLVPDQSGGFFNYDGTPIPW